MKEISRFLTGTIILLFSTVAGAQEIHFFSEATDATFYNQGIVDVNNLGESTFEHTHPPGLPQYNDKIPASTNAFKGQTSLKFSYTSAENGNWKTTIYRNDWSPADISGMDSLAFYLYAENELPTSALPKIAVKTANKNGSGDVTSQFYNLSEYNNPVPENEWAKIKFPLEKLFNDDENSNLDFSKTKGIVFAQSEFNNTSRLFLIDELTAFRSIDEVPQVQNLSATGYDSHAELNWKQPLNDLTSQVWASFDGGSTFELRGETNGDFYLDFVPEEGKNTTVTYRVVTQAQQKESEPAEAAAQIRDFTDDELLDMVQRYTFRYFWEGAHQSSGMILERSNGNDRTAASGATGMGLMAMVAAHEREYEPRDSVKNRILKILDFLENSDRHHGAWSHWYNADTGKTQPFSPDDDGGDIVETSFVAQALIALKHYFSGNDNKSVQIREKANQLWREIEWGWYRNNQDVLFWHWSPNTGFAKGMKVSGWNEALITYIMAASSPTHAISKEVYTTGWARNGNMVNPRKYYEQDIRLAPNWGGPLFFTHYTHLGINPHGLADEYADYWQEHVNTAEIHHAYSIENPKNFENYSDKNWGLTASDDPFGYTAHKPMDNDNGTISPTAALSSMPYTPEESLKALKYFYRERGAELFGKYGTYDAFNDEVDWVSNSYLGIDQGPIVVMIENYRSGLLWQNVMKDEDVQAGLEKLGFQYEVPTVSGQIEAIEKPKIYPNPTSGVATILLPGVQPGQSVEIKCYTAGGRLVFNKEYFNPSRVLSVDFSTLSKGFYMVQVKTESKRKVLKLMVR